MLTIYEHSPIPPEFLKKLQSNTNENLQKIYKNGKSTKYCGVISIDGESLLILPKIEQSSDKQNLRYLLYMILYANNLNHIRIDALLENLEADEILEFFIQVFAKGLFLEVERGFYREYQRFEESLRVVRGKILHLQDARLNRTREKIYCEYDEFTPDNYLNRLLYFATDTFLKLTINEQNRHDLKALRLVFDEVELFRFGKKEIDKEYRFSRINERFKKHYELALFILEHLIFDFEGKDLPTFGFLFDMGTLFEKFVGRLCEEELGASLQSQQKLGKKLSIKPDIIIENIVIDTKYKIVNSFPIDYDDDDRQVSHGDIYQMFAYCKALGFSNGVLLYPKHFNHNFKEPNNLALVDDVVVSAKFLDLHGSLGFDGYVKEQKAKLKSLLQ